MTIRRPSAPFDWSPGALDLPECSSRGQWPPWRNILALPPHCCPTRKAQGWWRNCTWSLSAITTPNPHLKGFMCIPQPVDSWAFCPRYSKSCCPAHFRTTQGQFLSPWSIGFQLNGACNSDGFGTLSTLFLRKQLDRLGHELGASSLLHSHAQAAALGTWSFGWKHSCCRR